MERTPLQLILEWKARARLGGPVGSVYYECAIALEAALLDEPGERFNAAQFKATSEALWRRIDQVCTNCGHREAHDGPAGDIDDACTHPGCTCGFDSR